ncbi:hypothetical protein [Exiguobacterium undae]|uniref:hypothetical protein n=1 Tax=Exiguobacterium undae TaxID=169177 RepID=UPI00384DF038
MASTLVKAFVLTGVGAHSGVADAAAKTTQVAQKKFDYKKYRAKVEANNKKSQQYMTDRKKAQKEATALKKLIKEVNTQKEKKVADKRIAALKKETARLTKAEKVLLKEGQALYKVIVD